MTPCAVQKLPQAERPVVIHFKFITPPTEIKQSASKSDSWDEHEYCNGAESMLRTKYMSMSVSKNLHLPSLIIRVDRVKFRFGSLAT